MNLKPNQHKIISFNTTTMKSLGFIDPPKILGPPLNLAPPKFNFLLRSPQLFWSEIFRSPPKIGRGAATMAVHFLCSVSNCYWQLLAASHKSIILKGFRKEFQVLFWHYCTFVLPPPPFVNQEEMRLNTNRSPNPNPKGGTKVQQCPFFNLKIANIASLLVSHSLLSIQLKCLLRHSSLCTV